MVAPAAALPPAMWAEPPAAPEAMRGVRLLASGAAVLIHGGMAGLLLLSPATPPGTAAPEPVPILALLSEPLARELPAAAPDGSEEPLAAPDTPAAEPAAAPPEPVPETEPPPDASPPEPGTMPDLSPPEPEPPPADPAAEPTPQAPEPERPLPRAEPPRPRPQPRPAPRPARTGEPAASSATADPVPRPAAGPPPSYLQALLGALEREKRYPEAARARRATGVATLRFTVMRDGRVAAWRIERSAGDAALDRAVEAMILRARLPAMPAEMAGDRLEVAVPIRFQLR
jgi:protein TonB